MCRIIQIFPDWMGSPVAFFLFPYSQQGYMNFNSWWAAYNSSSLGANMTGDPGFPYEKQTGHLQKVSQWTRLSFRLPILYSVSFQDYYPHGTCFFTSLNLEVIWRPTSRKENSIQKWRNWRYPIHPRASRHPCTAQPGVLCAATVRRSILAAWMSLFFFSPPPPRLKHTK